MSIFTTEITSDKIPSDNPLHHRLLSAYFFAENYIMGDVMELDVVRVEVLIIY